MVVFGILGLLFIGIGLVTGSFLPNPLARLTSNRRWLSLFLLGGLIGGFLIGRPFPLFVKLFQYAASTHNPALGAAVFGLQSLGNMLLVGLMFLAITMIARGRIRDWLVSRPDRLARFSAASAVVAGTFLVTYWCVRLPAYFGIGWWPRMPWS